MNSKIILLILVTLLWSGCLSALDKKEHGIRLNINASTELNTYEGGSHPVAFYVFQLKDRDQVPNITFDTIQYLMQNSQSENMFSKTSKFYVSPGYIDSIYFDREQDVNYLMLVAGYYSKTASNMYKIVPITVRERNRFFWRASLREPADTVIDVHLLKKEMVIN